MTCLKGRSDSPSVCGPRAGNFTPVQSLNLSPATTTIELQRRWMIERVGTDIDDFTREAGKQVLRRIES